VASLIAAGGDDGVTRVEMWATMALFGALQVLGTYRLARNFGG
jgi:hypothetical protein